MIIYQDIQNQLLKLVFCINFRKTILEKPEVKFCPNACLISNGG
ncbi:hypothetical protein AO373_0638 [Moraxella catarrhalis]|nr:hypothetical protein AO373_0638 [Moraxella catarrhalis]